MSWHIESSRVEANTPQRQHALPFEVQNDKMLEVNLGIPGTNGEIMSYVWIKTGSMVAYRGQASFAREGMMEHGFGNMLKKALTDEGMTLTKASTKERAQVYVADYGKIVSVLRLQGDSIVVNGNDLLAFEPTVSHTITMMKKVSSIVSAGLYNVKLSGHGFIAILSHGHPISLIVGEGHPPVFTDPQATVAWSGNLKPEMKSDIQFKTLLGRGSGESFQMKFDGEKGAPGFVIVQPFEEIVSS
ncbi:hypothetical protein MPTK1_4g15130 [Marchantia polymorpha subsp. ruderalis]|uniref:Altered inheritance of mitochondria protein 24, mitochondrial n=2 Tax=Marchantia polymorpha TaxID=3197 RepID=A0AAF6BA37_MARPO|nr:hypothetical protein MARPO_0119s0036 [Marchantia polymorpha]BBN08871.1 hypothetical protein Mp_4g15130 [Marchantia polymorpha subsp. ruderalis]|eukprot:PTQ30836.1 hypothetical protein MARPO_0119s0036 [Marchantia polymorpha]